MTVLKCRQIPQMKVKKIVQNLRDVIDGNRISLCLALSKKRNEKLLLKASIRAKWKAHLRLKCFDAEKHHFKML